MGFGLFGFSRNEVHIEQFSHTYIILDVISCYSFKHTSDIYNED